MTFFRQIASSLLVNRILPPLTVFLFIILLIGIYRVVKRRSFSENSTDWAYFILAILALGLVLRIYAGKIFMHHEFQYLRIAHSIFRTGYFSQCINSMGCIPPFLKAYIFYPSLIASTYIFTGVTLKAGTVINLVFGTLVVLLAALTGYLEENRLTAVYYAFLTALFPLAIGYSKIPDSHISGIFFMFLTLVLLRLSEKDQELFFLAVISAILSFNSKQYHIFLALPIISKTVSISRKTGLKVWVEKKVYYLYYAVILFACSLLFPHNYDIITSRVLPSQGLGISNLFFGLSGLLNRFPVFWFVLSISLICLIYSVFRRENTGIALLFTVYATAALTHAPGEGGVPLRILNPALLLLFFFGAKSLSIISRKAAKVSKSLKYTASTSILVLTSVFFLTSGFIDISEGMVETEDIKNVSESIREDTPIYTFKANRFISVSKRDITDLNYRQPIEDEKSDSIAFIGSVCRPGKAEDQDVAEFLEELENEGFTLESTEMHRFGKTCMFRKMDASNPED